MADLRPQYTEEIVGHGHPTKDDVANRAWNVEHAEGGTHKNSSIKKEHINTDIRGTGLAGGAGTALSVDGIVEVDASAELKVKVIDIGNWDMDAVVNVNFLHGLTLGNIRTVDVVIRADTETLYALYYPGNQANNWYIDATRVYLSRANGGAFDSVLFDTDPYNRGWVTIWYIA